MCGRFTLSYTKEEINDFLKVTYNIDTINHDTEFPRYNIAPSQKVLAVIHDGKTYRAGYLTWGLIPKWATPSKLYNIVNVRSETLINKGNFNHAFTKHRCIILADGFYEWQKKVSHKIPMHIHMKDHSIFGFAGIYYTKTLDDSTNVHTCAIITTNPNDLITPVHDRMPVILPETIHEAWLKPHTNKNTLYTYLRDFPSEKMAYYQVSTDVNKTTNDYKALTNPVTLK